MQYIFIEKNVTGVYDSQSLKRQGYGPGKQLAIKEGRGFSPAHLLTEKPFTGPGIVSCTRPVEAEDLGHQGLANTRRTNTVLEFIYISGFEFSQNF